MLRNYFLVAFRNLAKNKIYSLINLCGLAIGMAACLVIYLFIHEELSFDKFHQKKNQIYRLDEVQSFTGTETQKVALSMPGMGPNLANEFPEIRSFTRFWDMGSSLYQKGPEKFLIDKTVLVDSTFLEIFDFELLSGDRSTALDQPNSMVITEQTARKIFNSIEVLGKELTLERGGEEIPIKITGVLAPVPDNSHLQFDVLGSITTVTSQNQEFNNQFGSNYLVTYLLLNEGTDIQNLESKFPDFMVRHMNEDINQYYKLYLQPLTDIHLGSTDMDHDYHNWKEFDGAYVSIFIIMAIFVLLIAGVNFMNLSTARSATRSKEVGLRKSIGANKNQIINQFLGESVLLSVFALLIAIILSASFVPYLNGLTNRSLSLPSIFNQPEVILLILAGTLLIGIISGIYPAFVMSSFSPVKGMKGKLSNKGKKSSLQNILVIGQFVIAITLIISTILAVRQLNYMKNKDIGFNKDQILLIPLDRHANEKYQTLKTELLKQSGIEGVTAAGQRIGNNFHQWGFKIKTDTTVTNLTVSNVHVDYDYMEVYDIKLTSGRSFSREYGTDPEYGFIVNEALVEELGLKNPLGQPVGHGSYHKDSLGTIIGVTTNFNFNSLHHKVNTLVISLHPGWGYEEMSVRISPDHMAETIANIKSTWDHILPGRSFDYSFLDQHFETLYASDEQMTKVVPIIAMLSIVIACLGLFGLSTITVEQRIKEIGVRKALGASLGQLFLLLSKDFVLLIFMAFIISIPITYYFMEGWLANFAFHIRIGFGVFMLAGILSLAIAIATVSYKIILAAKRNPAEILKYE
ncbi:ABC transporter permease [Fulvivirgaceae bacterium BMA12]|uniref:ABC transporter permease n=1 Tax=Agaribacillus aureus TaxID=3051825 RepID=A0ABT8L4E9_9BACT|nr:ABC transporter permease [Fulvivirgaceae bacterium BMA12]